MPFEDESFDLVMSLNGFWNDGSFISYDMGCNTDASVQGTCHFLQKWKCLFNKQKNLKEVCMLVIVIERFRHILPHMAHHRLV